MRHKNFIFLFVILFSFLISCKKKSVVSVPPDPAGTTTDFIYSGGSWDIYLDTLRCGFFYDSINHVITGYSKASIFLNLDTSFNLNWQLLKLPPIAKSHDPLLSIASMGNISGLGQITTHPSTGYSNTCPAILHNGYVLQVIDYDSTYTLSRKRYYRIYLMNELYHYTSKVPMGFTIKFQGPY